jgi:SAM-dependent methyltransferase
MINFINKLGWQLLEHSIVYRGFRFLFGSENFRKHYASVIDAKQGDVILDIECGTGDILNFLPHVQYVGFDINEKYINTPNEALRTGENLFVQLCKGTTLTERPRSISC